MEVYVWIDTIIVNVNLVQEFTPDIDSWYQYDVCNDCRKVLEDGIRPIDDNGDI